MTDPSVLTTPAFRLIEQDFKAAIQEGPTYICDIYWKFKFRRNVIKLKEPKYPADIYNACTTGKSDWICKSCPTFSELDRLCPIEFMLISQIIKRKRKVPSMDIRENVC